MTLSSSPASAHLSLYSTSLILGLLCLSVAPTHAQSVVPEGPEFQANTYTVGDQLNPAVATNEQGRRVVVWQSGSPFGSTPTQDGAGYGIYGQVYDATGAKVGSEFRVNDYTAGSQRGPAVAMTADGRFTVVWDSDGQDGSGLGIVARRFSPEGTRLGTEFIVNTTRAGLQSSPSISMDAPGNEIVVWSSQQPGSAYAQRYDTAGGLVGGEFRVSPESNLSSPRVALLSDGGFVAVGTLSSGPPSGPIVTIQAIRYGPNGLPTGPQVQVNTSTATDGSRRVPVVAARAGLGFVVAWEATGSDNLDIFARRYDASGVAAGGEFMVNTLTSLYQREPAIAMNDLGQVAVAWTSFGIPTGGLIDVAARFYDETGTPRGNEFLLNPTVSGVQEELDLAINASGFVAAWTSYNGTPPQDGDGKGVFGQQFRTAPVAAEPGVTPGLTLALAPNPVDRASGSVRIALQAAGPVRLSIVDALGREVAVLVDGLLPAGERTVPLDTAALPAGIYVVRLTANGTTAMKRLVVVR